MRFLDLLLLSTRMFKTRPMRTLLTVLGVSIGIATVLFLVSLGYGLQSVILDRITTADALLTLDVSPGPAGLVPLDPGRVRQIEELDAVDEVSPLLSASAQMTVRDLAGDGLLFTVKPSFFRLGGLRPMVGELFSDNGAREVVISSAASQLFNATPEELIGEELHLTYFLSTGDDTGVGEVDIFEIDEPFTIVGVVQDDNSSFVYAPISMVQIFDTQEYSVVKVKVKEEAQLTQTRDKMIELGFSVSALLDTIEQANKIFRIVQTILGLFGIVALIVSAVGMFNTMTVTLLERTNEIGIMRSIGTTRGDIQKLFLAESTVMGFLGGFVGVALGFLAGEIANFAVNILAKNFGGQSLDLFVQPFWFVAVIIVFSAVIGFITGVFPARRAAHMNPLDALRYK